MTGVLISQEADFSVGPDQSSIISHIRDCGGGPISRSGMSTATRVGVFARFLISGRVSGK
jgi:hypothetical protein